VKIMVRDSLEKNNPVLEDVFSLLNECNKLSNWTVSVKMLEQWRPLM